MTDGLLRPLPTARLKSLELQGYKTFATKTVFEYSPSVTAIIGPNGSGKSNIADAIRWVLGEQSYSLLRGKKTEDMIFAGSEARPRASMASAMITFDNSDGWLPIEFSEVTVGRRAYRDGQNEYILNGQRVRLRDVSELLAESGLAERTYTIIGQGLVDAALSLKAEERRRLFEEAAGIELYRSRREEALRRLESTQRNLERVQDIAAELRPRLRSLERQAQRAREFIQVTDDLKEGLRVWYGYQWYRAQDLVEAARREVARSGIERDRERQAQAGAERALDEQRDRMDALRAQLQSFTGKFSGMFSERERWGRQLAVSRERLRWLKDQEALLAEELEALASDETGLRERLEEALETLRTQEAALGVLQGPVASSDPEGSSDGAPDAASVRKSLEALAAREAAWRERARQLEERAAGAERRRAGLREALQSAEAEFHAAGERAAAADRGMQNLERRGEAVSARERTATTDLAKLKAAEEENRTRLVALQQEQAAAQARWQALGDSRRRSGTDRLRRAAHEGALQGLVGALRERIQTDPAHRMAVLAALSEGLDALAFQTSEQAVNALRFLAESGGGGVARLISLQGARRAARLAPLPHPGCLGNAADFVRVEPSLRPAVEALLGRSLVVRDRAVAVALLDEVPPDARLVTLQGEVFSPTGLIVSGALDATEHPEAEPAALEADLSARRASIGRLEARLASLEATLRSAIAGLDSVRQEGQAISEHLRTAGAERERALAGLEAAGRQVAALRGEAEGAEREAGELRAELAREQGRPTSFEAERVRLTAMLQAAEARANPGGAAQARAGVEEGRRRAAELRQRLEAQLRARESREKRLSENRAERERLEAEREGAEREAAGVEARVRALTAQSQAVENEVLRAEESRRESGGREREARAALSIAEQRHSQAQVLLARREEELNSLKRRIDDDFGLVAFDDPEQADGQDPLPLEGWVERLQRVDAVPQGMEAHINRLRGQLRRIGAVNPEAKREYDEVRERVEFMTAQLDDLRRAESQMQDVITELDLLMEREFRVTFEAVAAEFRQAFTRLFGGGSARLALTDPEDLTSTGIDIEARLPGRREQGLSMLSGGERSLTACALVFALLKVSPTPFCVLDEVDAMLDESNVLRFCEMVKELSADTQFLLITHNRQTVQTAEVVYGVSMGQDSASRVISLRLDEAVKEIAA